MIYASCPRVNSSCTHFWFGQEANIENKENRKIEVFKTNSEVLRYNTKNENNRRVDIDRIALYQIPTFKLFYKLPFERIGNVGLLKKISIIFDTEMFVLHQ